MIICRTSCCLSLAASIRAKQSSEGRKINKGKNVQRLSGVLESTLDCILREAGPLCHDLGQDISLSKFLSLFRNLKGKS